MDTNIDTWLDIEQHGALITYLRAQEHIGKDETPRVRDLPGGVSNRTVLVELPNGEAWVLKQSLAKLRVSVDWFSSPERIHREALGLRWLAELAPAGTTPALLFEDHEQHLLAMTAVPLPHDNWKTLLLTGEVVPEHLKQFAQMLATIHGRSALRAGEVEPVFADRSFFESLRIEPYYAYTATQIPAAAPFLAQLIGQTRERRYAVVHGDYSPKNVLVHQGRLVLLDYEVIHFGDPAFDLGFSITHLLSKAHHLPGVRAHFAAAAVRYWQVYRDALGNLPWAVDLELWTVRHTLGCLLARVSGRSTLEYLDETERARQRSAVVALMQKSPTTLSDLVRRFVDAISTPIR